MVLFASLVVVVVALFGFWFLVGLLLLFCCCSCSCCVGLVRFVWEGCWLFGLVLVWFGFFN